MTIQLYYAPGSSAFAPLVCLSEAEADFLAIRVVLASGEQHSDWFRAVSSRGRVPVLAVDGLVITETIAILTYIAQQFPEAQLLPLASPIELARAYELMAWLATGVHVTIAQLWRSERFVDDLNGKKSLEVAAHPRLERAFEEIEARIAGPWALDSGYSALDPYLAVFLRWVTRLKMDIDSYPRWKAQNTRLFERRAVQNALRIESVEIKTN